MGIASFPGGASDRGAERIGDFIMIDRINRDLVTMTVILGVGLLTLKVLIAL